MVNHNHWLPSLFHITHNLLHFPPITNAENLGRIVLIQYVPVQRKKRTVRRTEITGSFCTFGVIYVLPQ